jgi:hypothetical protein
MPFFRQIGTVAYARGTELVICRLKRFFPGIVSFDPDATRTLGLAFDKACALLGKHPQPTAVRVAIAKSIVEAAKRGERDTDRLRDAGLAAAQGYVVGAKVA